MAKVVKKSKIPVDEEGNTVFRATPEAMETITALSEETGLTPVQVIKTALLFYKMMLAEQREGKNVYVVEHSWWYGDRRSWKVQPLNPRRSR